MKPTISTISRKIDRALGLLEVLSARVETIEARLSISIMKEQRMASTLKDLKAEAEKTLAAIADESSKDDSIIALVLANNALIKDLRQQLADAIAANDPQAIQDVLDLMTQAETSALANSAKVLAAVNANTEPPPAP
jgi:hypothetical protein